MKKILVVDDEFDLLDAIKSALEREHYEVLTCEDSSEAMAKVREWQPDLMLTDLMMPNLDGYQLIMNVREQERTHRPIVLMSLTQPTAMKEHIGWDEFLQKPFNYRELVETVQRVLQDAK